jgi:exodeoxyribonuclease VII small subunit
MIESAEEERTYTQSAEALEAILDKFRTGLLPLETALALFEEAIGHLRFCQAKLGEAKGRVEVLVEALNQEDVAMRALPFEE